MPTDLLTQLQASVTKTATFNGAAMILPGGTPRYGLKARVIYSAATNASGSNSVTFQVDVCYDGVPTLWTPTSLAVVINLSTTAQNGEIYLPFDISPTSVVNGTQIRLTATFAGAGSTPTITYVSDLVLNRP